jgi:hypothetical protein
MQGSFLQTLYMFIIILLMAVGIQLFIFGLIFRKKKLWVTGLSLFSLAILCIISIFVAVLAG